MHIDTSMQRFAAAIEFCGLHYHGWQWQKNQLSVQQVVEQAISKVADHDIRVTTAGRTDSGVHATNLVIHFNSKSVRSYDAWLNGINRYLPADVSMPWIKPVPTSFHARYSAQLRRYRYIVFNRQVMLGYLNGRVAWHRAPLDLGRMQQAAALLEGEHDFSAYRAASCQAKSTIKNITHISVSQHQNWFYLDIAANGFLHHMVRNIMGVLLKIGEGSAQPQWAKAVLDSKDRSQGAKTASAAGLYFVGVEYPSEFAIPETMPVCRFW